MKNTIALHIRPKAQGSLEILMYDDIGEGFFGDGITSKAIREQLSAAGLVDQIHVRINSIGGTVSDGFAIYNALKEHPANVTTYIDGDAMSIASIIALAGDTRVIAPNARIMIHEARVIPTQSMTERDIESTLQNVRGVNETLVATYVKHTGQSQEQIRQWMAAETYMSATEALERGFVDQIAGSDSERIAAWAGFSKEEPMTLQTIALAMGLVATASMDQIVAEARTLKAAAKKASDERDELVLALGCDNVEAARGAAVAAHTAITHNQELETRVADLETAQTEAKRGKVLARIKAAGKSTPAMEKDVFPKLSIEALESYEKSAPTLVAKSNHQQPQTNVVSTGEPMTHNGKAFEDMTPAERHAIYNQSRETYDALRQDAVARGRL